MIKTIGLMLICCLSFLFAVMVFELMVGCGEKTYFAEGHWITNECLFIPHEQAHGRWK
jgi:hypothetical protein